MKRIILLIFFIPFILLSQEYTGNIIIEYKDIKTANNIRMANAKMDASSNIEPLFPKELFLTGVVPDELAKYYIIRNENKSKIDDIINSVKTDSLIINYTKEEMGYTADAPLPDDPYFVNQYYLVQGLDDKYGVYYDTLYNDLDILNAWRIEEGDTNLVIGIIDSWLDSLHADISDRYIGRKVMNTSDFIYASHATECAGILMAEKNNTIAISGVADVSVFSIAIFDGYPPSSPVSRIANAIVYAAGRVPIINASIVASPTNGLPSAVNYFTKFKNKYIRDGSIIVAAAGNDNSWYSNPSPASLSETNDGVISVTALGLDDKKSSYANYRRSVDVAAKSDYISVLGVSNPTAVNFRVSGGTSYSVPQVVGVIALIVSKYPGYFTKADIKSIIKTGVDEIYQYQDRWSETGAIMYEDSLGTGRINAYKALKEAEKLVNQRKIMF